LVGRRNVEYSDPIKLVMLSAASTDETASPVVPLNNTINHTHGVVFEATVTAGIVEVQVSPTRTFTGAPKAILVADATVAKQFELPGYVGPGFYVRHIIKTAVADGTVSSWMRRRMHT
jgi:hypothetical protein